MRAESSAEVVEHGNDERSWRLSLMTVRLELRDELGFGDGEVRPS